MPPKLDNANALADYPMIVQYLYCQDGGPTDGGRDCLICPHCGAKGRYIHYFICDDGRQYGAMSGCIKLFPISKIAQEDMRLHQRASELKKKGWKLNSWEQKIRESIDAFYRKEISKDEVLEIIRSEKSKMAEYRQKKYGKHYLGRRW